jgi:DNA-binding MarR family transcriptional regulator
LAPFKSARARLPLATLERSRSPVSTLRLTARRRLVLGAIAAEPGLSNRQIAKRAWVKDEGQISKLLARLAALELIENQAADRSPGAPNCWRLTRAGERVDAMLRARVRGEQTGAWSG